MEIERLLRSASKEADEIGNDIKNKLVSFTQTYLQASTLKELKVLAKHLYSSMKMAQLHQDTLSEEMKRRLKGAFEFISTAGFVSAINEKRLKTADMTQSDVMKFFGFFGISL